VVNLVVSVDQSYSRVGSAVMEKDTGKVLFCGSIKLKPKYKVEKRKLLRRWIKKNVLSCIHEDDNVTMVIETVRVFSHSKVFLNSIAALTSVSAMLCDIAFANKIPIYQCDTRHWKSLVLKNSGASKQDAVNYAKKNYGLTLDHDAADALCIAVFGCLDKKRWQRADY